MGLLSAARRRLETIPVPDDDHVFIHGDSWLGNPVWTGENKLSGMIDWDAAGVGAARIDLGSLRFVSPCCTVPPLPTRSCTAGQWPVDARPSTSPTGRTSRRHAQQPT